MWQRLAEIDKNPVKKALIQLESYRIRKTEKTYSDRASLILAAPNDIEPTYLLGEDFLLDSPDIDFKETEECLLFVGTLTWEANIDGLLWFLNNVYPKVIAKCPGLKFYIVGKKPDSRLVSKSKELPSITLTGYEKELEP